jgi:hypothetical protein
MIEIRKVISYIEDTLIEGGKQAPRPLRMVATAAVLKSPWAGQGFVEDLRPAVLELVPALVDVLVPRLIEAAGGQDAIEAYGKAAVVGVHGEVEHAAALIHQLRFGNELRQAAGGTSFLSFTNTRGGVGCAIVVPMTHKTEEKRGSRAHFLTLEFNIPDAPAPDEIVVAIAAATGGRPHHRIGDRYQDMKEMGVDHKGGKL